MVAIKLLTAAEVGKIVDATPRAIRSLCKRGVVPGARKIEGQWWIPRSALSAITDPDRAPRIASRQPIEIAPLTELRTLPRGAGTDPAQAIDRQISIMELLLTAMLTGFQKRKENPLLSTMIKQMSSELRELRDQRIRVCDAAARTIEREVHEQCVDALTELIRVEGATMASAIPDSITAALVEGGVVDGGFTEQHRSSIAAVAREQWENTLSRMMDYAAGAKKHVARK